MKMTGSMCNFQVYTNTYNLYTTIGRCVILSNQRSARRQYSMHGIPRIPALPPTLRSKLSTICANTSDSDEALICKTWEMPACKAMKRGLGDHESRPGAA